MKKIKQTLYSVSRDNIQYVFDNYQACVISDDKRTVRCNNITIQKSLCHITNRYTLRTDKYGNVYNYFLITHNQDGVLTMTTVGNDDVLANKIENLYSMITSNALQK